MKKNLKSIAKFTAAGLACTALVGAMSCNVETIAQSNDIAGVSCAFDWCSHKKIKILKTYEIKSVRLAKLYKLGFIVGPGQTYSVETESHESTSIQASTGIKSDFLSAELGVTIEKGTSKSVRISGKNNTKFKLPLYQSDYYNGKSMRIDYQRKTSQGDLLSNCKYESYVGQLNQIGTFDEAEIFLLK